MSPVRAVAVEGVVPTRAQAWVFFAKCWALRVRRWVREAAASDRPRRHPSGDALRDAPVLAEFAGPLWHDADGDVALTAGKLQNLRVALRAFDGVEVPANATFGFWRQLGRATRRRGFVAGRELREGCLVPSIGGGLCLLSNALHDCAVRGGLAVVERHRHSRVVPGSLAEHDRDATVFWNYLDLRLRAPFAWRMELAMDADRLRVRLRGHAQTPQALPVAVSLRRIDAIEDCHACGRVACHRHVATSQVTRRFAWLPAGWPEYHAHAVAECGPDDRIVAQSPMRHGWRRSSEALRWRLGRRAGHALPALVLAQAAREARLLASRLDPLQTHVLVPQTLLPFLWRAGVLAGRRFDVWMTALPMDALQRELDRAVMRHPGCRSLADFRAPHAMIDAEREALAAASRWISPHAGVLALAGEKACRVPWQVSAPFAGTPREAMQRDSMQRDSTPRDSIQRVSMPRDQPPRIFLAASPLARKGAFELRDALRGRDAILVVPPGESDPGFADGVRVERAMFYNEGLRTADVVALPAWIEHQPRGLLAAIASGIPVIATPACGLGDDVPWHCVEPGNADGLRLSIDEALAAGR